MKSGTPHHVHLVLQDSCDDPDFDVVFGFGSGSECGVEDAAEVPGGAVGYG